MKSVLFARFNTKTSHHLFPKSAVFATLCVYGLLWRLLLQRGWEEYAGAGLASLALSLSPLFWSQAVIAEVYALNALFVALILEWTLRATRGEEPSQWAARLRPIIIGLALGNHVTIALPIAVWALASLVSVAISERLRWIARNAGWIAVGLLVYIVSTAT